MERLQRIAGATLFGSLSAFGATELVLSFGLRSEVATLVGVAAFIGNFLMIEPVKDPRLSP